jgi:diguanylate cyclase
MHNSSANDGQKGGVALLWARLQQCVVLGTSETSDPVDRLNVIQINICMLLAMVLSVVFNGLFLISGNWGLILSGLVQWPFVALMGLTFGLNAQGHYRTARFLSFSVVLALLLTVILVAQGTALSIHYYLLVVTVLAVPLFRLSEWFWCLFFMLLSLGLFIFFEYQGWPAHASVTQLSPFWLQSLRLGVVSSSCTVIMVVVVVSEVTSEHYVRNLASLAMTDALTGLPNRRVGTEKLVSEIAQSHRAVSPLAVAMVDIDYFKKINDEEGHEVGDLALHHVVELLTRHVRATDVVARMGGEEFLVVMPNTSLSAAHAALDAVRQAIATTPFQWALSSRKPKGHRMLTVSIGVAAAQSGWSGDQFLQFADAALYEAKAAGRNQVIAYSKRI